MPPHPLLVGLALLVAGGQVQVLDVAPQQQPAAAAARSGVPASREEWLTLKDGGFVVPAGVPPAAVLRASEALLGDRDPALRDDVAYGLAVAWIYRERRVTDPDIRGMAERLRVNLADGRGGDAVLRRSFSALVLSVIAAADLKGPILDEPGRAALVESGAGFLEREPDTRGYDPEVGWVHATAHASDLLKFLARSPSLTRAEQQRIVAALLARTSRDGPVFVWGEDDRIAAALRSVVARHDFDAAPLDGWMAGLAPGWNALWQAPRLDTAAYARLTNARHVLESLYAGLAATKDAPAPARDLAARILETLTRLQ